MDLLFKRYASPFLFINEMIRTGQFCDFVINFIETLNEEKNEKAEWEFFLHKVWEKSFAEFKESIQIEQDNRNMSASDIETTIKQSQNILANFNPEETEKG